MKNVWFLKKCKKNNFFLAFYYALRYYIWAVNETVP